MVFGSFSRGRPLYDALCTDDGTGGTGQMTRTARSRSYYDQQYYEEYLLRVELDDQLLLHLGVDHLALGQRVHEDPQLRRNGLQPRRHGAVAGLGLSHLEGGHGPG